MTANNVEISGTLVNQDLERKLSSLNSTIQQLQKQNQQLECMSLCVVATTACILFSRLLRPLFSRIAATLNTVWHMLQMQQNVSCFYSSFVTAALTTSHSVRFIESQLSWDLSAVVSALGLRFKDSCGLGWHLRLCNTNNNNNNNNATCVDSATTPGFTVAPSDSSLALIASFPSALWNLDPPLIPMLVNITESSQLLTATLYNTEYAVAANLAYISTVTLITAFAIPCTFPADGSWYTAHHITIRPGDGTIWFTTSLITGVRYEPTNITNPFRQVAQYYHSSFATGGWLFGCCFSTDGLKLFATLYQSSTVVVYNCSTAPDSCSYYKSFVAGSEASDCAVYGTEVYISGGPSILVS